MTTLLAATLVLMAVMIHATNSAGQDGMVSFRTSSGGVNAPVRDTDGTTLLAGNAFRAQLYAGPQGSIENALQAVGVPVAFGTGGSAGYVNGGTVTVTGIAANTQAAIQMRVWETAYGTTFEQALAAGSKTGRSIILTLTLGGGGFPPTVPAALTGLQPFSLTGGSSQNQPPAITSQPQSRTNVLETTAVFSVTATGTPPLSYQWRFNNSVLAGATSTNLSLTNVQFTNAGNYTVVVTNVYGSVTSAVAVLAVASGTIPNQGWVVAWGDNSTEQTNVPPGLSNAVAVAGGYLHSLALRADGTVIAWGDNLSGQINVPVGLSNVTAIAAGMYHSLALRSNGTVVGWGDGAPGVPAGLSNLVAVACGRSHSLALRSDGTVVGWGGVTVPEGLSNVVAIAAGGKQRWGLSSHSLALRADGTVVEWGNYFDDNLWTNLPAEPPVGLSNVMAIACGTDHSLALRSNGTVVAWGANPYGQTNVPAGLANVAAIAGGLEHSLARLSNGTVVAWGTGITNIPNGLINVGAIAAGWFHNLAVTDTPGPSGVAPSITVQPQSRTNDVGTVATFSVTATGTAPLSYQWRFNNGDLAGAKFSSLALSPVQLADAGNYTVVVTNAYGSVTSQVAVLTVSPQPEVAPSIISQPQSLTSIAGTAATFSVTATGTAPLSYQWRKFGADLANGGNVSGATSSSLSLANVQPVDAADYLVVIANAAGAVTSTVARLTVMSVLPLGEALDNPTLTWTTFGNVPWFGQTDVTHDGVDAAQSGTIGDSQQSYLETTLIGPGTLTFWWRWDSDFLCDMLMCLVDGTPQAMPSQPSTWQQQSLTVSNGVHTVRWSYSITCDFGGTGPAWLDQVSFVPEGQGAPVITGQPQSRTNLAGTAATFSVTATGDAPLNYQWRKNGANLVNGGNVSGANSTTLSLASVQLGDGANYQVVVTNAAGSVTSVVATLTVLVPPAITAQPQSRTNLAGTTATFSLTATGTAPLSYLWRKDGVNLAEGGNVSGANGASLTLVNVQPVDAANYQVVVTNAAGAVTSTVAMLTVRVPPAITSQPQSRTNVAGATATFTVTASGDAPLNYQWLKNGASLINGGNISGANSTTLSLANVQLGDGANYQVIVANTAASATSAVATLTVLVPPAITGQPQSRTNIAGTTATFSVTATGTSPLSYQWRKQGIGLPGATAATLTLTGVQPADAADYTVVVTNMAGSVTSAVARLTVIVLPTIGAQPQSRTNLAGTTATFSVTAGGDPPLIYQWLKNGANMVDGGNVSGANSTTLSLANVQLGDGANYQAVVANAAGSTTSVVAKLTVVMPPAITAQPQSRTNAPGSLATFSVVATGTEPLGYQWRFNGVKLAAANSSTYSINNVQSANAGLYTVVVTNAFGSATSAPASLVIQAYCVIAQVAAEAYPIGTAVPVQVRTCNCANTNAAVPNVPAVVWIRTQGTSRSLSLVTDGFGQATVYFQPLASEAGAYEIAAGIGSEVNAPAQDTFALVGMSLTPSQASHRLKVGVPESGSAVLQNLSAVPLTGLSVTVESQPGNVTVQSGAPASLGGNATGPLSYTLTATGDSPAQGAVILRVNSAQGVAVRLTLNLEVASAAPCLVATPSPLNAAMLRGGQALVSFEVANVGGTASGNLDVLLPGAPWLALVSPSPIASLAPGQTNTVTLALTPSNSLALGPYPGSIVLQGGTTNLTVPFQFNCVSSLKGGLRVTVVDEFTYFVSGAPKVTNATVTLADPYSGTNLASAATDASGEVLFTNLTEAYYEVTVQANKHGTFKTTLLVPADQTFDLRAFLPREMVSYRWQVTPTSVRDRYEFVLDTTFETYVPIPVVTVDPGAIDLCAMPGDTSQINLVITNHGLMAAKAARLGFTNHPLWEITPLVENLGDIAARSSVVVPVIIRRLPGPTNASSQIEAHVDWRLVTADGPLYYRVPIYVYNAGLNDCAPGSTGSVPFAPPGGGGGGGGSAEAPFVAPPPAFAPPDTNIVRVTVGLQLKQSAVMSRNGFEAVLELINNAGVPLTDLSVMLDIRDAAKEPVAHLFGVRPPELSGLNAVDGSGLLNSGATGRAMWTLIPATNAAPNGPTPYTIGGELVYVMDGQTVHIPLFPVPITVLPDPRLVVDYFWERDVFSDDPFTPQVEPAVPFGVGLRMKNVGLGTARAVTITSAQPQIVRNDSGLLIDFKLIGAQVGNQPFTPSLTADLGDIGPSNSAVATWWMTSTLEGRFIEYDATFQHLDDFGNQNLSLIDSVTIHEMIHVVRADLPSDDGIPDFLVNEDRDTNGLPDHLYLSDGSVALVTAVTNAAPSGVPTPGNPDVLLAASLPAGWVYLRIPDPGNAAYPLSRVRRSDGRELLLGQNAWLTHRVVRASGQANRVENWLHLVDTNSTGFYTVSYGVVVPPPVISSQPQSRTNIVGTSATFSVTATSAEPLNYQWQRNGTNLLNAGNISGATSATLTLGNVQPADASLYQVVVSNVGGSVTSAVTRLTVWVPPAITGITVEPQSIIPGTTVTFNVSATGDTPLNYQWRKNGANLVNGGNVSGATSATLVLSNAQAGDAGNYQVVVTNHAGAVTSPVVPLTYVQPPAITVQPQSRTNLAGATASFSVTANGTAPLSHQWFKNGVNLANGGNVSGASSASLTLDNVQPADGADYQVVITNIAGAVTSVAAKLTVWVPPTITVQPQSRTNLAGATANFSVSASGTGPLSYQWRKEGTNLTGATAANLMLTGVQSADAGNYTVVVTNIAGAVTSVVATLTVWVRPTITGQPQSRTNIVGTTANFSVTAAGTTPLTYQWRRNGADVLGATGPSYSMASVTTNDEGNYAVVVTNVAGAVTSQVATLTVWVPPTITVQPQSRTNLAGTTATFGVVASGTGPLNYPCLSAWFPTRAFLPCSLGRWPRIWESTG